MHVQDAREAGGYRSRPEAAALSRLHEGLILLRRKGLDELGAVGDSHALPLPAGHHNDLVDLL